MKSLMLAFLAFAMLNTSAFAQAQRTKDQKEITALVQMLRDGLVKRTPALMGKALSEDVVFVSPSGHYLNTKEAVVAYHVEALKMIPEGFEFRVKVTDIQFIHPDVAIAHVTGLDKTPQGKELASQEGGITAIRKNGSWKIAHFGVTPVAPPQG